MGKVGVSLWLEECNRVTPELEDLVKQAGIENPFLYEEKGRIYVGATIEERDRNRAAIGLGDILRKAGFIVPEARVGEECCLRVLFSAECPVCECCGEEPYCTLHRTHAADCRCIGPAQVDGMGQEIFWFGDRTFVWLPRNYEELLLEV